MLAQTAPSLAAAMDRISPAALEWKLDGVRVQVHRQGEEIKAFTRTLDEVTNRVPEIVESVAGIPIDSLILDGEVIALRADGRPRPFQETGSRVASRGKVEDLRRSMPLTPYFFDVLHLNGRDLMDLPASESVALGRAAVPEDLWVPRTVTDNLAQAERFVAEALDRGHEGVMVKSLDAAYEAGRRGSSWIKVKPYHTLDLVVIAAEWGHGRREGLVVQPPSCRDGL